LQLLSSILCGIASQHAPSRPAGVVNFQLEKSASREFPVDIHAVLCVRSVSGSVMGDYLFVESYDYVYSHTQQHPLVPSPGYMFPEENYQLIHPEALRRPALLVPNVVPDCKRNGNDIRPRKVTDPDADTAPKRRPNFFWVDDIL
jgi:hypothetical protein